MNLFFKLAILLKFLFPGQEFLPDLAPKKDQIVEFGPYNPGSMDGHNENLTLPFGRKGTLNWTEPNLTSNKGKPVVDGFGFRVGSIMDAMMIYFFNQDYGEEDMVGNPYGGKGFYKDLDKGNYICGLHLGLSLRHRTSREGSLQIAMYGH